jgi:hypothetical protein
MQQCALCDEAVKDPHPRHQREGPPTLHSSVPSPASEWRLDEVRETPSSSMRFYDSSKIRFLSEDFEYAVVRDERRIRRPVIEAKETEETMRPASAHRAAKTSMLG